MINKPNMMIYKSNVALFQQNIYNGRASAMPPKGQSRVFSKLGHKEGKELIVESA